MVKELKVAREKVDFFENAANLLPLLPRTEIVGNNLIMSGAPRLPEGTEAAF